MSKSDILQELSKLPASDRQEIFEQLCRLQEADLVNGIGASEDEKALLDREWEEYQNSPGAGSPWSEVKARLGSKPLGE